MAYDIAFQLASPVMIDTLATFDGPLAWCVAEEAKSRGGDVNYDEIHDNLPLVKRYFNGGTDYVYSVSGWFVEKGGYATRYQTYVNKRFPRMQVEGNYIGRPFKIDMGSGDNRSYRVPLTEIAISCMHFHFDGDVVEVERLVKKWLRSIGKKTAIGKGAIKSYSIEKIEVDPILTLDGAVKRPVPLAAAEELGVKTGLDLLSVRFHRPPYSPFHPDRQVVCIIPDERRMLEGGL